MTDKRRPFDQGWDDALSAVQHKLDRWKQSIDIASYVGLVDQPTTNAALTLISQLAYDLDEMKMDNSSSKHEGV